MAAADDLSAQLAARQAAYRLIVRDRTDLLTWMQRLLAGITQPQAPTGSFPPAGGGDLTGEAATQRAQTLRQLAGIVGGATGPFASNPQIKSLLDGVTSGLTSRADALTQSTVAPAQAISTLMAASQGTPAAPVEQNALPAVLGQPQATRASTLGPSAAAPGSPGGATGWLGDIGQLTTPVLSPGLGGQTQVGTPNPNPNPNPTPGGTGGQQSQQQQGQQINAQTGGGFDANGPPAGWSSSSDDTDEFGNTYWYPPDTSAADAAAAQAAADKEQNQQEAAAAQQAKTDAAYALQMQQQYDAWIKAANTDYQYAANMQTAANAAKTQADRDAYLARAKDYTARGDMYAGRVPADMIKTT